MHELSLCQAIVAQVERLVAAHQARGVSRIEVQVGPLAGVEAHLLRQAFPLAAAGTGAAQAELVLTALPVKVHCRVCGADSEVSVNRLLCGHCGAWQTTVLSGDELLLARVELLMSSS
ncbi:hydrogenase maturation nickel metallochaperone HypA [Thiorhodospira sibirica]|uniref:hydrogenase maturation nickel metallochaperone HypA/HybF n=1 Tax=Thiorhodospira sibirica TaxID=154347 RepID=UPI00022C58B0|nr:hydrogenase maturation nickel metallochaperone HypA [Thiorhodospira sibirica]